MQITIYHKDISETSKLADTRVDRIEYAGQTIEFRDGNIRVETVDGEPCPLCKGTGQEICDNPDHGFISAVGGEIRRLGCPCCGHDYEHRIPGTTCEMCGGIRKKRVEPARRSDMYEDHVVSKMDLPPGKSSYRKKTNMTEHEMGG
uniref:Uncharacterized protein n=1 Tax=viral metagenome TaxID=1070528 RepID=A0A6M3IPN7_9ZZZZ